MGQLGIPAAFIAGLISFLSPCVLPLVPGYVSMISGASLEELKEGRDAGLLARVFRNSLAFILGFTLVFVMLGASATWVGKALLEQKTNALDQAAPLMGWELPEEFSQLRRLLEARLSKRGKREYVQVLRLLETFSMAEVSKAVEDALRMRAISFDAVKHLLLCRIEQRPPRLDLENYPHLPLAQVATTAASDYLALLTPVQEGVC